MSDELDSALHHQMREYFLEGRWSSLQRVQRLGESLTRSTEAVMVAQHNTKTLC